jgi:riboflavin-specific deaminase-like protein
VPEEHEIYRDLTFPRHAGEGSARPYVLINMVASVDGRTAVEGKASGLGTAADRSVMRTLRSKSDAVMVGGGTLRAEKVSLGLDTDDPRPRPLAVIWTATGDVGLHRNLVRDPHQSLLVLLSEHADEGVERNLRDLAQVRRVPARAGAMIDTEKALQVLKTEYGIDLLLCEGGPTLNHALISANLADELFVTLAPVLLGGAASEAPSITKHHPDGPSGLHLLSAHPIGDELFLRYAIEGRR